MLARYFNQVVELTEGHAALSSDLNTARLSTQEEAKAKAQLEMQIAVLKDEFEAKAAKRGSEERGHTQAAIEEVSADLVRQFSNTESFRCN